MFGGSEGFTEQAEYEAEVEMLVTRLKDCFSKELPSPSLDIDDDQTVETDREIKAETQTETEVEVSAQTVKDSKEKDYGTVIRYFSREIRFCDSFKECLASIKIHEMYHSENEHQLSMRLGAFPLDSYLESDPALSPYASAFEGIYITLNALDWHQFHGNEIKPEDFELLGDRRMPFQHLLVEGSRVTLMNQLESSSRMGTPEYYNLTLGYIDSKKKLLEEATSKIVKLKFFNGDAKFSSKEIDLLRLWLEEQGPAKMHQLYVEHAIQGDPHKANEYRKSSLKELFAEMRP